MKIKFLLIILIVSLLSCSKKENSDNQFKYFEFSYNDTFGSCFSIKATPNDSIYIREHWNAYGIWDSTHIPKEKTNYIAVISKTDRKQLMKLITQTQLKKYDSIYDENFADGMTYIFYINKDSIQKSIYIHSHKNNVPKELDSLGKWIYNWKKKAKLIQTDKKLTFKSSKYILPPPPPPPIKTE
ncbi:hypothetical protein [Flavobacterium ginsengiterrae]|uniref:DUF6438 domain-containing protein n=1 Tax=Flavobacterium ginsengiterrae TaxID=871695 RepID=A0ABP7GCZ4_9FLAO